MNIRPESTQDAAAIREILIAAFEGHGEADLVERLRADRELVLALVAEQGDDPCGYVAFPRLVIGKEDDRAHAVGLAPLAVVPGSQRRGIGDALVRAALRFLAAQGETLVFVLGDPAYYTRFGFESALARPFACLYAGEHFMALRLGESAPRSGEVRYPAAFAQLG